MLGRGAPQRCLFLLCCILNVLPLSGSEGEKETWVIVVNVPVQVLGLFGSWMHHTAYSINSHSLAGSSFTSAESTHGIVCPVKVEHGVFLKVLPSNFTDLVSRRRVALLTALLSFWYLLNYWDSFSCVIICWFYQGAQLYLQCTWFSSSPGLLLIFFGFSCQICVSPWAIFKQSFSHMSLYQTWFCCWQGPFSINPAGGTSSLFTKDTIPPSGGTHLLKSGLCCVTGVTFVVCIVKMLLWEDLFPDSAWRGLCIRMMPQLMNLPEIVNLCCSNTHA